ncbi:Repeat domain-containing protein [Streptomyces sp. cf386]|uniref:FG-GAP-like repeat-containing protein n=1 Tax=Streptomyces sp. cf386 TaxID=1761904 RepID=UPI000889B29A|nr:FG-GAP-like repeat-containing protein [Streptomyces sp. cf386]SDO86411.1 Repeat domain-containing protein [Streptomyces sp. cf386]
MASPSHRRTLLSRRRRLGLATGVVLVAGALAVPAVNAATTEAATATPSTKRLHDDFNGDGYPDLAIGAPGTTVNTQSGAGSVSVLYGSASGLSTSRKQVLKGPGVPDPEAWQGLYGGHLQSADLDGDGYADLLSSLKAYVMDLEDGYAVQVNWGGPKGLSTTATRLAWAPQGSLAGGWTGQFTVADVDGDKHPDLVTLSNDNWMGESPETDNGDGTVFHGPFEHGGWPARKSYFRINPEGYQNYEALTSGDVNGDGIADLAVQSTFVDESDSRGVELLLGGADGFTYKGLLKDAQGRRVGGEDVEIGDLNKDGYGDIVVGHSLDSYDSDVELPTKGGALAVVHGGPAGVSTTRKPVWINQDTAGVPGTGERGDGMGSGLSIADTNGDGYLDVATGLPGEDLGSITDAGAVLVLRGSANGLTATGVKTFTQNTSAVPGTAEKGDRFGAETALVDADGDKKAGLIVGDPAENAGNGSVWVFSATSGGITAGGSFSFGSATMGLPASGAKFGASLAD